MQYTINLYRAYATGLFAAKACTQSTSQQPLYDNHNGVYKKN